ncbi:MAG: septation protein IspZ [Patescibacteria group bacterium]
MTKAAAIHLLTEFAPVLIFFVAGQLLPFETAAILLVITTALAMALSLWYEGRLPFLPLVSGVLIIISGLITYFYQAPDALILGDTLYYLLLALIVGAGLSHRWYFLKWLFQSTFAMKDEGWRILSYRWLLVFIVAAIVNELVRVFATPEVWVDYRFAKVILIAGFGFYQFTLSRRYRLEGESNKWGLRLNKLSTEQSAPTDVQNP